MNEGQCFHSPIEIPFHEIRASKEEFRNPSVFEIIETGVFEEASYDGSDVDILAHTRTQ